MSAKLFYSQEVASALKTSAPIVALESTIISHGMPYPANLEVAHALEEIVRKNGAIPATIAILPGKISVGLSGSELEIFAQATNVWKCSNRDIPYVLQQNLFGATTVAATMQIAAWAGIRIFATGGIGGVHRQVENTMDISADLYALASINVAVVSAGAKAILDLPRTLEFLETASVPVIGFDTDYFPTFYSRQSDLKLTMRMDDPQSVADFLSMKYQLGMNSGVLIANPIPEENSLDSGYIEKNIDAALQLADHSGIKGKELTPFLLRTLNDLTDGKTQQANRSLVLNDAMLAAGIAKCLSV